MKKTLHFSWLTSLVFFGLLLTGCGNVVEEAKDLINDPLGEDDIEIYSISVPESIVEQTTVNVGGMMTDANQSAFSYLWATNDGSGTFEDPTAQYTTFTAPEADTDKQITITLTACSTESKDQCDTKSQEVTITPSSASNRPPTIQSISLEGQTIDELSTQQINAIVMDEDGDELTYQWSASKGSFTDQTALSTTYTAPSVASDETITITLSVTDGKKTNSLSIYITVQDTAVPDDNNTPVIQTVNIPSQLEDDTVATLTVLAYDPDSSNTLSYFWSTSLGTLDSLNSQSTNYTPPDISSSTTDTITITVCDNYNVCASQSHSITITPADSAETNTAPRIESVSIPDSIDEATAVSLSVLALDDDGDALTYFWSADKGSFSNNGIQNPTYTSPTNSSGSSVTITVEVCDTFNSCVSQSKTVSVNENNDPYIVSLSIPASLQEGSTETLNVLALDDDGDTLSYFWTVSWGGGLSSSTSQSPSYTAPDITTESYVIISVTICDTKNSCITESRDTAITLLETE